MLLREKDKKSLLAIFSSSHIPFEIWAYGSRVNGQAHSGSDLDLVLRTKNLSPLPSTELYNLNSKIQDSNIPILVELRDWALLPPHFHKAIEENHEVLYSAL